MVPSLPPLLVLVKARVAGESGEGLCNAPHCLLSGEASSSPLEKNEGFAPVLPYFCDFSQPTV